MLNKNSVSKNNINRTLFQEDISLLLNASLTEEQRFLQNILNGEIKTFSHEKVVTDLRKALKR